MSTCALKARSNFDDTGRCPPGGMASQDFGQGFEHVKLMLWPGDDVSFWALRAYRRNIPKEWNGVRNKLRFVAWSSQFLPID